MTIEEIQKKFIKEASSAPTLFSDLAKVEIYISESYRTRAFTELLQNADDAKSTQFIIRLNNDILLVANNGIEFTSDDVSAICRSGASNKVRGSDTIGYRGIGFKSLAGIAKEITVVSGSYAFKFSKEVTQTALNISQDVPLIRIPHTLDEANSIVKLAREIQQKELVTTVFILQGLNSRVLEDEINAFDENSILFINHVRDIHIELPSSQKNISKTVKQENNLHIEFIRSEDKTSSWIVEGGVHDCEKVAFKYFESTITPCSIEDSLIHAFLPTNECTGAYLKFNGDFSTDPSRKSIDLDELSKLSFNNCCRILADLLRETIKSNKYPGIFTPLVSNVPIHGRFRSLLREQLILNFNDLGIEVPTVGTVKLSDIILPPDWMNYEDYEGLCKRRPHLPLELINNHSNIIDFFQWLGAKPLTVLDSINFLNNYAISSTGSIQIMVRFMRQYRFDMNKEYIDLLYSSPLLPIDEQRISPENYSNETLSPDFIEYLCQIPEIDDIKHLFKRLELPLDILGGSNKNNSDSITLETTKVESQPLTKFKHQPAIKKWRSAELNASVWFESLAIVAAVKDVSMANIGYDLDVLLKDGSHYQVEVKSVKSFVDLFRMTNNEHATAYQHGDSYLLVFIINSEPFEIQIVQNPISQLNLEKRCEQWTWVCEDYSSKFIDLFNLNEE